MFKKTNFEDEKAEVSAVQVTGLSIPITNVCVSVVAEAVTTKVVLVVSP